MVTDNLGHVWAGDGAGNIIEADATKAGTAIIRKIATGGKFRVDEMAYDQTDQILMASSDGDSLPFLTLLFVKDGAVLGQNHYPAGQVGMEQPAWVRETGCFYQNVPGDKNRIDAFDPHKLPNPVISFPVECKGGALGLTLSGLVAGPNGHLMTVCGSLGGLTVDPRTGKTGKRISQVGDADEVWYDGIEQLLLPSRNARGPRRLDRCGERGDGRVYYQHSDEEFGRSFGCRQREKRPHLRTREWKGHLRDYAGEVNNVSDWLVTEARPSRKTR